MKRTIAIFCLAAVTFYTASAQYAQPKISDSLPRVFELNNFDEIAFEKIKVEYETTLLTASKNDAETAYYCWIHLLKHLETFSQKRNIDLNGVKLWMYVFWQKDGTIDHVGYFLKPHSKNIETEVIKALLSNFCDEYKFPLKADKNFSNYNSANFPVNVEKTLPENK